MTDFWSLTVTPNYSLIFRFENGNVYDIDYQWNMNMMKRNLPPVHPGEILREDYMKERNLTIGELAQKLGITITKLSDVCEEREGITFELVAKLSEVFGNTPQFWINLQKNYELWLREKRGNLYNVTIP